MGDEGLGLWMRHDGPVFVADFRAVIVPSEQSERILLARFVEPRNR